MSNYDSWLEEPYQRHYAEADAYVGWCEENDLDPEDDNYDAFQQAMEDTREDAEIAAWESRQEEEAYWHETDY